MKRLSFVAIAVLGMSASITQAGVYTDDMTKCLVESTSSEDRIALVRWMFAAMSQHPAVASFTNVKPEDIEKASATTGALFMRLLTETCVDSTKKAVKYEGLGAIQTSFGVLGQVATMDLFADANVMKVMAGLEKYTDSKKLAALGQQ